MAKRLIYCRQTDFLTWFYLITCQFLLQLSLNIFERRMYLESIRLRETLGGWEGEPAGEGERVEARALSETPREVATCSTGWLDPQILSPKFGSDLLEGADWVDQLCGWTLNLGDDRRGPAGDWPQQVEPHQSQDRQFQAGQRHQSSNCLSNAGSRLRQSVVTVTWAKSRGRDKISLKLEHFPARQSPASARSQVTAGQFPLLFLHSNGQ